MKLLPTMIKQTILPKLELATLNQKLSKLHYLCNNKRSLNIVLSHLTTQEIIENHLQINSSLFNEEFFRDSFLAEIDFRTASNIGLNSNYAIYKKGTLFPSNRFLIDENGFMKSIIHLLKTEVKLPVLFNSSQATYFLSPLDVLEARLILPKVKGDILVSGVQLGYFLFHAASSEQVSSITVVEEDICLIHFFKQFVLPQFREKGIKIRILQGNLIDFVKNNSLKEHYTSLCLVNSQIDKEHLQTYLLIKKIMTTKNDCIPIHYDKENELDDLIHEFAYFITYLKLNKNQYSEALILGKKRCEPHEFLIYSKLCEHIFHDAEFDCSAHSIKNLLINVFRLESIF